MNPASFQHGLGISNAGSAGGEVAGTQKEFHQIPDTPFKGASEETMIWLRDYLTQHGVTTTIRASRGQDIYAACGLLHNKKTTEA